MNWLTNRTRQIGIACLLISSIVNTSAMTVPFETIDKGDFPKWNLKIQVVPEKDASKFPFNPFDLTKVWPHGEYPLIDVGVLELNKNPENYFAEVEQSAFNPTNIVPGIGFSPDKMP